MGSLPCGTLLGVVQMSQRITFAELLAMLNEQVGDLREHRSGRNVQYSLATAVLSAFSVFYMQSASFLAHQKLIQSQKGNNNVRTLFGVEEIPTDPQLRNLLDPVAPESLAGVFGEVLDLCAERGYLEAFRTLDKQLLCALDGTRYFWSNKVHCASCSVRQDSRSQVGYAHYAVIPVIAAPDKSQVLALAPSFVEPQDGVDKQDCELRAASRWLQRYGPEYAPWRMTLLGDDLYCHQPFCQEVLTHGFGFIFVCKADSHITLYEWVDAIAQGGHVPTLKERVWNGRHGEVWTYRYLNNLPLKRGADALLVNWCELTVVHEESGDQLYYNAFVTNHALSDDTVKPIAQAGRTRWKIENEGNNVLKTKGYHMEHNFGHGQNHLASTLFLLNLLAFLFHSVLELGDWKYKTLRAALGARRRFFTDLEALTRYLVFPSWEHLLDFMFDGLELPRPP